MKRWFKDLFWWVRKQVKRAKVLVGYIVRFLTHDLWNLDEDLLNVSRWKTRLITDLKVILILILSFSKRRIAFQATALAFRTILALVPLIAVVLYGLSQFGFDGYLEGFILSHVHEQGIVEMVLSAARNLVATSTTSLFGFISCISFFWILIWMMLQVITVFDNVWGNIRKRSFGRNFIAVIVLLILMPLMLLIFIGGFLMIGRVVDFVIPGDPAVKSFLNWFTLGAITVLILSLMYTYIPSVKVRYRYALRAALFAGAAFTLLEYLYFGSQAFLTGHSWSGSTWAGPSSFSVPSSPMPSRLSGAVTSPSANWTNSVPAATRKGTMTPTAMFPTSCAMSSRTVNDPPPPWLILNSLKKTTS